MSSLLILMFSINNIPKNESNIKKDLDKSGRDTYTQYDDKPIVVGVESQKEINSNTTDWELVLVNTINKISDNYNVNLSSIENYHKVDSRIVDSLKNMLKDARKEGLNPIICSSYRTNNKQVQLYNNKTRQYLNKGYSTKKAKELASYSVAIPGTSEHEIGLAVDIVSKSYQILGEKQEKTEVQKWLIENCCNYGFILRYSTDKKGITMINYEPWNYRYVGIENAKYMKEKNMCLEEYVEYLKQYEEKDILV